MLTPVENVLGGIITLAELEYTDHTVPWNDLGWEGP